MNLITVKSAHNQADLVVLKSRLESEEINCFLKNELTAQVINYVPAFLVELQVCHRDLPRVEEILAESGESIHEGKKTVCTECGSENVKMKLSFVKRIQFFLAIFWAALAMANVPLDKLFKQTELKCRDCGTIFS